MSEERTGSTPSGGVKKFAAGAAAVALLAAFGGVAYAQQNAPQGSDPGGQAPAAQQNANPGGSWQDDCPEGWDGGRQQQQGSQQTEV